MAKAKKSASVSLTHMNYVEQLAGTIFFIVYLLVMPLLAERLFRVAEVLLDTTIERSMQYALYYYVLFAVTLIIFHDFLFNSAARFFDNLRHALSSLLLSLLVFYGANELAYRVLRLFFSLGVNLNDRPIAAQVSAAPRTTAVIVVLLSPIIEEVLFRGLVFGGLRGKSRVAAYALSAALYAFHFVWQAALAAWGFEHVLTAALYLIPGLVFAWACERSGTVWCPILLHAAVNALALWSR